MADRESLEQAYDRARRGLPGLPAPENSEWRSAALTTVIGRNVALAGGSGFALGLPGIWLAPLTIPADLYAQWLLQMHLVQSLAVRASADLDHAATRRRVLQCVQGTTVLPDAPVITAATGLRQTAQKVVEKLTRTAIERSVRIVVSRINRRVLGGFPIVGGLIGLGSNAYAMLVLAQRASAEFAQIDAKSRLTEVLANDRSHLADSKSPKSASSDAVGNASEKPKRARKLKPKPSVES